MPISEIERHVAEKVLREYCTRRTDPSIRDELEIVFRLEGNEAYISERRPDWRDPSIVRDHEVAKFRFVVKTRTWQLYWRDRNLRWHRFDEYAPSRSLAKLLPIVDEEPIFYG